MAKRSVAIGLAAGIALLSATVLLLYTNKKSRKQVIDNSISCFGHGGKKLANKSRHRAQHLVSAIRMRDV